MTLAITDRSDLAAVQTGFDQLLCLHSRVADHLDAITEQEKSFVDTAVSKRRYQYATGRWLARNALAYCGIKQFELLPGERRQPVWPADVVGSIAHTEEGAVVAIAKRKDYLALGIDLEYVQRVDQASLPLLLLEAERKRYYSVDKTLIFSAKEACYKLLNPLTHEYVDFLDIAIDLVPAKKTFTARYVGSNTDNAVIEKAQGRFTRLGDHWLTIIALARP